MIGRSGPISIRPQTSNTLHRSAQMTKQIILCLLLLQMSRALAAQTDAVCLPAAPTTTTERNPTTAVKQDFTPIFISSANLNDSQRQAYEAIQAGPPTEYVVEGATPFDNVVLAAKVIVFTPGSSLILGGRFTDRGEKYIVAQSIKILPGSPAPRIIWPIGDPTGSQQQGTKSGLPQSNSFQYPSASPGGMGAIEGSDGRPGSDGQTGNPGVPGRGAPTLLIFAKEVNGGTIGISLRGEDGGEGQPGQPGGDGGLGRTGRSSVLGLAGISGCRADAADGGQGGPGGDGGRGGPGGRGGNGGNFIFVTSSNLANADFAKQVFQVDLSGGAGGSPAAGGKYGLGGQGGSGGNGEGPCKGGQSGSPGPNGRLGPIGTVGSQGLPGQYAITPLSDQQIKSLGLTGLK